jgi:hypothetical protein
MSLIKYLPLFLMISFFCYCTDTEEPTPNCDTSNSDTSKYADVAGTYIGSILSKDKYTPTGPGTAFEENNSYTISVNISNDSTNIYLDGTEMQGGPEIFTLDKDGNHILTISSKTIEYSFYENKTVLKRTGNQGQLNYEYFLTRSRTGVLRKG